MGIIAQKQLFSWENIEELGDLERLDLVLRYIPDQKLIAALEKKRGNGRDDNPIELIWNSILAGVIFEHISVESLRRELQRNGQLRDICGFEGVLGSEAVPSSNAYSRFLINLFDFEKEIDDMFKELVATLTRLLSEFGKTLAIDGKAIPSLAKGKKASTQRPGDKRRDSDADWGFKKYCGKNEQGTAWEKIVKWFGFKLHLIVDANYELPVAFEVTRASVAEQPVADKLLKRLEKEHPAILENCQFLTGDKGYDTIHLNTSVYDDFRIKPVIDIRNCWKDADSTKLVPGTENVVYNYKGDVSCVCPVTLKERAMAFGGFEQDRRTLKYVCPAKTYGIFCKAGDKCRVKGAIRIKLGVDRRVFTPLARSSDTWKKVYNSRTSVERVNSRLDVSFGFERHYIRGEKKMKLRCGIALCIMLALAVGRIMEDQKSLMRSLVKTA
ncbi:MAG: transposase [Syntrophaceae bacterium]|nr:transposase [Syntrophaceae bacterium]